MLPFLKVFSLVVRAFSRPVVNHYKKYLNGQKDKKIWSRSYFIWMGKRYDVYEQKLNRKLLNLSTSSDFFMKQISYSYLKNAH